MQRRFQLSKNQLSWLYLLLIPSTFIALLPISGKLAYKKFDQPYKHISDIPEMVAVIWPDHVELRPLELADGVMYLPANVPYSFFIPPNREKWVQQQLRQIPPDPCRGAWDIKITQQTTNTQEIQLDCVRNGVFGLRYQASKEKIVPLVSRLAGAGAGLVIFAINAQIWAVLWFLFLICLWLKRRLKPAPIP